MKKLIAGNWKMNLGRTEAAALANALVEYTKEAGNTLPFTMVVCPPTVWLTDIADVLDSSPVLLGAQDVHEREKGAYTGNNAGFMLKEAGASYVLVGHSERRQYHHEDNALVKAKAQAAINQGLIPIICVGEIEAERSMGNHETTVARQLAESLPESGTYVVAYEPVWAIGTGKTATPEDVRAMHAFIRKELAKSVDRADQVAILYGGSVKAANAAEILSTENVDGVLVGGASLQAEEFWAIAREA